MPEAVVQVSGVSKKFRRGELHDSLRDLVPALARRLARGGPPPELAPREFWALSDVSFAVERGEALGVIGGNGAGKTTLLRLLGGILRPTRGTVRVAGRLSAMIEVSAGFHPDLTGRENVFLYGTILGMTRDEIRSRFDAIVAFSGLEEFMDTPVKRYSSGMFARLGFSVAAHVDPDVLLVDEVLSVGDLVFQRRCVERMREVLDGGAALVFVSHNLRAVTDLCGRALLLERGRLAAQGGAEAVVQEYLGRSLAVRREAGGGGERDAWISRLVVRGADGEATAFRSGDRIWVEVDVVARRTCEKLSVTVFARDESALDVFNTSTERLGSGAVSLKGGESFRCTMQLDLHLAPGTYYLGAAVRRYDVQREYDEWFPAATLLVSSDRDVRGTANLYPVVLGLERLEVGRLPSFEPGTTERTGGR